MRRRTFMAVAGSSAVAALAGCISEKEAKESGFATDQSDTDAKGTPVAASPVVQSVWTDTPDMAEHLVVELESHDVDPRSDFTVRAESVSAVQSSGKEGFWHNTGKQQPTDVSPVTDRYWLPASEAGAWTIAVRGSAVVDGSSVVVVHVVDVDTAGGVEVLDVRTNRYVEGEGE